MIDSSNFTIAIVGYVIVFLALLILYVVFANLPKLLKIKSYLSRKKKNLLNNGNNSNGEENYVEMTGQENAALATAIYMYLYQMHDEENTTITIKKVKKDYTPWSSKIHSMNNQLHR